MFEGAADAQLANRDYNMQRLAADRQNRALAQQQEQQQAAQQQAMMESARRSALDLQNAKKLQWEQQRTEQQDAQQAAASAQRAMPDQRTAAFFKEPMNEGWGEILVQKLQGKPEDQIMASFNARGKSRLSDLQFTDDGGVSAIIDGQKRAFGASFTEGFLKYMTNQPFDLKTVEAEWQKKGFDSAEDEREYLRSERKAKGAAAQPKDGGYVKDAREYYLSVAERLHFDTSKVRADETGVVTPEAEQAWDTFNAIVEVLVKRGIDEEEAVTEAASRANLPLKVTGGAGATPAGAMGPAAVGNFRDMMLGGGL